MANIGAILLLIEGGNPCLGQEPVGRGAGSSFSAQSPSFRIAGKVVSSTDGHALGGATVLLEDTGGHQAQASTLSDEEGRFAFSAIRAGKYSLQGLTQGFVWSAYEQHGQFSTAIVTGTGVDTESLVLRLTPAATLSGRVSDEVGEPLRDAKVTLYRQGHAAGKSTITQFRQTLTDDLGFYEIDSVLPGTYFLEASAVPWYAIHPRASRENDPPGAVSEIDPSLDVAYPSTFYADVTDADEATPIPVRGGEQMNVDLHLVPQPAVRMTLHMTPGQLTIRTPQLNKQVFDGFERVPGDMQFFSSEIRVTGLPPGRYEVEQMDPTTGEETKSTGVDLRNGSMDVEASEGEASGAVKVSLRADTGAKLPALLRVALRNKDQRIEAVQLADEHGESEFRGVQPGQYGIEVDGESSSYHVTEVESEGKRIPKLMLQVVSGSTTAVTVGVSGDSVAITGIAKRNGKPAPGVMVVLVPADPDNNLNLFRRDQSDLDGSFLLHNVVPGKYTILAIENGWELEWGKANVLAAYLSRGVALLVPADRSHSVPIREDVVVQGQ